MKIKIQIFVLIALLSSACSVNKLLSEANDSFSRNEFYTSAQKYSLANQKIKDKSLKSAIYIKMAESYRQLGDYAKATVWYRNAVRSGHKDSTANLLYADALRGAGKPEESKPIYEAELKKNPQNERAVNGMESIRRIQDWKDIQELYQVENLKTVNSAANDQIVQILSGNEQSICIRSSRDELPDKKLNPVTGQKFSSFFTSIFDTTKQKWTTPKIMDTPKTLISPEEKLSLNIDKTSQLIIFAKEIQHTQKPAVSQLFFILKKDGTWTPPALLPFETEDADYTDPMITEDGKTLWFASNRAKGKGGFDIWKSEITGLGSFSSPENAGSEINTPGNEICPFQKPNGYFYFSSDYHPGIGGYDIFQAQKINSEKWKVEQLPPPMNSSGDDIAIQFFGNQEKGFFSSNRKGSRGMDVYSFFLPTTLFQCFGHIRNSETDSILPDVNIRIVGSDGSSQKIRSVSGQFQANLNPGNDYAIVVYANGYLNAQAKISTRGLRQAKEFEVNIKSVPTNQPIRIDNISYESGKWELLPQSKNSLEKLVDLLKLNPGAVIEISSHTDEIGDDQFNLELSEKRAASVVAFLTEKGIPAKSLKSKGYGESSPLIVSPKLAGQYNFLRVGEVLNSANIEKLGNENLKEVARGLNRRTEFKVVQVGLLPDSK